MSDLVGRLRSHKISAPPEHPIHPQICEEAANEIERMRDYVGNNMVQSNFRSVDDMRAVINQLRERAGCIPRASESDDSPVGYIPCDGCEGGGFRPLNSECVLEPTDGEGDVSRMCSECPGLEAENTHLRKRAAEATRLQADWSRVSSHPLVLEQGGTSDGDRARRAIDKLEYQVTHLRKRAEKAEAIVAKLPVTKDGVRVVSLDVVWNPAYPKGPFRVGKVERLTSFNVNDCYSTQALAEAEKENRSD